MIIRQRFQVGDIVRFHDGKVDWEVVVVVRHDRDPLSQHDWHYILKSGMSGRHVTAFETDIRAWRPHE